MAETPTTRRTTRDRRPARPAFQTPEPRVLRPHPLDPTNREAPERLPGEDQAAVEAPAPAAVGAEQLSGGGAAQAPAAAPAPAAVSAVDPAVVDQPAAAAPAPAVAVPPSAPIPDATSASAPTLSTNGATSSATVTSPSPQAPASHTPASQDPSVEEPLVAFGTRVAKSLLRQVKREALERDDMTLQAVTDEALRMWLAAGPQS